MYKNAWELIKSLFSKLKYAKYIVTLFKLLIKFKLKGKNVEFSAKEGFKVAKNLMGRFEAAFADDGKLSQDEMIQIATETINDAAKEILDDDRE